jgi:hypothetical protein
VGGRATQQPQRPAPRSADGGLSCAGSIGGEITGPSGGGWPGRPPPTARRCLPPLRPTAVAAAAGSAASTATLRFVRLPTLSGSSCSAAALPGLLVGSILIKVKVAKEAVCRACPRRVARPCTVQPQCIKAGLKAKSLANDRLPAHRWRPVQPTGSCITARAFGCAIGQPVHQPTAPRSRLHHRLTLAALGKAPHGSLPAAPCTCPLSRCPVPLTLCCRPLLAGCIAAMAISVQLRQPAFVATSASSRAQTRARSLVVCSAQQLQQSLGRKAAAVSTRPAAHVPLRRSLCAVAPLCFCVSHNWLVLAGHWYCETASDQLPACSPVPAPRACRRRPPRCCWPAR